MATSFAGAATLGSGVASTLAATGLTSLSYDLDRVSLVSTTFAAAFLTSFLAGTGFSFFGYSAFVFLGGDTTLAGFSDLTGDSTLTGEISISDLAGVGLEALAGVFLRSDLTGDGFKSDLVTDFLETDFLLTLFFTELFAGERPRDSTT